MTLNLHLIRELRKAKRINFNLESRNPAYQVWLDKLFERYCADTKFSAKVTDKRYIEHWETLSCVLAALLDNQIKTPGSWLRISLNKNTYVDNYIRMWKRGYRIPRKDWYRYPEQRISFQAFYDIYTWCHRPPIWIHSRIALMDPPSDRPNGARAGSG